MDIPKTCCYCESFTVKDKLLGSCSKKSLSAVSWDCKACEEWRAVSDEKATAIRMMDHTRSSEVDHLSSLMRDLSARYGGMDL